MEELDNAKKYNPTGSSIHSRFQPKLLPEYFKIDNRTIADFLLFTEKYADQIYAYEFDTSVDPIKSKTWKKFFHSDISVLLAKLSTLNQNDFLPFYLKEEPIKGYERQQLVVQSKLDVIVNFISIITDSYYHVLDIYNEDPKIKPFLDQIVQIKEDEHLEKILKSASSLGLKLNDDLHLPNHFELILGAHFFVPNKKINIRKNIHTLEELNKEMNQLLTHANKIIFLSKELFIESLNNDQNHNPGTALFITFLKLYSYVQNDLNEITGKHLDYFYKEILQQKIKPSEPDHVHVYFTLADHVESYVVEKGTLFKAGIDEEGYDFVYEADDFLTINQTKITDLCSIYVSSHKEVGIENSYEFISNIYNSEMLTSKNGGFDFSLKPKPFSAFDTKNEFIENNNIKVSEIGFAISSPVLLMKEGKRHCHLDFKFNLKSMSTLLTFIERYTVNHKMTFDKAFYEIFYRAFSISLTTPDGWYQLENFKLYSTDSVNGSFRISFELPIGAPSITGMGEKWDKKEIAYYGTDLPIVKLILTNEKSMFVYSYMKDLLITECSINVEVSGIKNLEVFNDFGKLDTSNPFYPFGALPVLGSSLLIGNEELYVKKINDISIELGWYNLPKTKGGFKTYYEEYDPNLENDSFKIGVSALSDFEFHPTSKEKIQQLSLFTTFEESQGQLPMISSTTILDGFDLDSLKINTDSLVELLPYSNKVRSGYLKLELLSPEMVFGQAIYPTLFSTKMLKGVKSSIISFPNVPYIPQLKSITISYKASTNINFSNSNLTVSNYKADEKVFLIEPFSIQTIFKNNTAFSNNFLPRYTHDGYLLLGLDKIIPFEPLTLYFIMEPSLENEFEVELPQIDWYFVSDDKWYAFETKDIINDTTCGFTTTGIVKLMMPKTIGSQNNVHLKDRYWIVAAIKGDLNLVAKLKGLYTQALKLTWKSHKVGSFWTKHIPGNTIESLLNAKAEIALISQPLPSFGGRMKESETKFYTRISERLNHRNRCITQWDYERIVLEKFPFIKQVKCISPIDNPSLGLEGKIILVVIPKSSVSNNFIPPRFNYSILKKIKDFVTEYSSPFVSIQVINPVYEEVKVTASIKFFDQSQNGIGVENLHRDLKNFICPWYDIVNHDMQFGGSINLDEIERFIDSRSYISYVTKLSILVLHYHDTNYSLSDSFLTPIEDKTIYASKPWSVLIPMIHHPITIIENEGFIPPVKAAIENLRLGSEFVLMEEQSEAESIKVSKEVLTITGKFVTIDIDL